MSSNKVLLKVLESVFPVDHCRELVKFALAEQYAKLLAENPVLYSPLDPEIIKGLEDPEIPEEVRERLEELVSLAGRRVSDFPKPTQEEEDKEIEDKVATAVNIIVAGWVNVLHEAQCEVKNNQVRLGNSLLPPPELAQHEGVGWDEWIANSLVLNAKQISELMLLFAIKLTPIFDAMIANNPKGFELIDGIFIGKDSNGFHLLPKVKN